MRLQALSRASKHRGTVGEEVDRGRKGGRWEAGDGLVCTVLQLFLRSLRMKGPCVRSMLASKRGERMHGGHTRRRWKAGWRRRAGRAADTMSDQEHERALNNSLILALLLE
jgi:hypothetical protein